MSTPLPRRGLQRGVIIVPNAFTLGNLFFGVWAIVSAARGAFELAAWLIVFAGIADTMDGRVARATKTGSKFGEELDSLVDAISFGVAPAIIIYHLYLSTEHWSWIAAFFYVTGAVIRLARFNVEQAGHAKVAFHGLPSPSAGMTLATFYPFSQTPFFQQYLAGWPWPMIMTALMFVLSVLMMSHVLYPVVPKFGVRTLRGIVTLVLMLAGIAAAVLIPRLWFFPFFIGYILWGLGKSLVLGFLDRLPEEDLLLDVEQGDEAGAELRDLDYEELGVRPRRRLRRRRRRRRRPDDFGPGHRPDVEGSE